jgi:hypothetical protein
MSMQHHHEPGTEHPAVHGMLIVGETRVLLSHLPMFHVPHDYQMLLEVSLSAPGSDPLKTYLDDRKATQGKVYTWVPKPFLLSGLDTSPSTPLTMTGTIFRGHFERGGEAITSDDVEAKVERVLYSRRLDQMDPQVLQRRYLMFGSPAEPFLAHVITRPPDFDQVTGIEITVQPADWLAGWDGSAIVLNIDGAVVPPGTPLREGDQVKTSRADDPANGIATVTVRREFYFETGDLAS